MENNQEFTTALELNERIQESVVVRDQSPEQAVELPTDEINIVKADEVEQAIIAGHGEEKESVEGGMCACTDCVEGAEIETDTDTMLIVHDLSERLVALEARIDAYNAKASHKI